MYPQLKHVGVLEDDEDDKDEDSEEQRIWKDIIFVPFNLKWKSTLLFSVFINVLLIIYDVSYESEPTIWTLTLLYYVSEFFYFADTVLCIMHR